MQVFKQMKSRKICFPGPGNKKEKNVNERKVTNERESDRLLNKEIERSTSDRSANQMSATRQLVSELW